MTKSNSKESFDDSHVLVWSQSPPMDASKKLAKEKGKKKNNNINKVNWSGYFRKVKN